MRRVALLAALVALLPVLVSFLSAVLAPSNATFGIKSVEWLRDHGGAGLVAKVESVYYSLTAPAKGGPGLSALPGVGFGGSSGSGGRTVRRAAIYSPPRVRPFLAPALPGEGAWRATRPGAGRQSPLLVTTLRNQPDYPRVVAGLAWIDPRRTTITLNPGRLEPAVNLPARGPLEVPRSGRGRLLATFNSAFKLSDSRGGVTLNGHTYTPLQDGLATLVGYRDGRVDVISWHGGSAAPSAVTFARQNLPLIVDHGQPNPTLSGGPEWGATLGNAVLVWRSAVGVDRRGDLLYIAGNDQSTQSLARTLIRAGAVRAMELDINSFWTSFISYGAPGALSPSNLLPDMNRAATRYLTPDDRDFFTVYAKAGAPSAG